MLTIADIPADVRKALERPFDFCIDWVKTDHVWFSSVPVPASKLIPIAVDGGGGVFAEIPTSGRILYVGSEGEGGIIAASLGAMLQLIVTLPYWRVLLYYSGGGNLLEMQRSMKWVADNFAERHPEAADAILSIQSSLNIAPSTTALEDLHHSIVTSRDHIRLYAHGEELESLFGRFRSPE